MCCLYKFPRCLVLKIGILVYTGIFVGDKDMPRGLELVWYHFCVSFCETPMNLLGTWSSLNLPHFFQYLMSMCYFHQASFSHASVLGLWESFVPL